LFAKRVKALINVEKLVAQLTIVKACVTLGTEDLV
jgi:hypothetical protein